MVGIFVGGAVASAQPPESSEGPASPNIVPVPEPPARAVPIDAHEEEVSDAELIRWAAQELSRARPRRHPRRPPIPPDGYLLASGPGDGPPVELGDEDCRAAIRFLAEIGGGTLGVLAGGSLGLLLVWVAQETDWSPSSSMIAYAAGVALGALGVSSGVTLAADQTGGHGNFGHAFLGQVLGSIAALPFVVAGLTYDLPEASLVAAGLLPLAGAVIGYELGHADAASRMRPMAFLVPMRQGALGGIAGRL